LEAPERSVAWILVVSLIMFFVSLFLWYIGSIFSYGYYTVTHDAWYYLAIVAQLFFILTLITSALCLARFAKKWMYYATVFLFTTSMILLFVEGLRPLF
jgi:hypothetical protein